MLTLYPGHQELLAFVQSDKERDFSSFIITNKDNIAVWSSTSKASSSTMLFSLWKERYISCWEKSHTGRRSSITHNKELWDGIFAVVTEIRITMDSYVLQSYKILQKMSKITTNIPMRAISQELSLTTVESTQGDADRDVHDEEGETDMNRGVSNDRTTGTSSPRKIEHSIFIPSETDRYLVEGKDMSVAFYAFQMAALYNFNKLEMETDMHHILALSSVLLVQNKRWHPDMIGTFTKDHLQKIFTSEQKKLKVGAFIQSRFPTTTSTSIMNIVKDVKNNVMNRMQSMIALYTLALASSPTEAKVIKCIAKLIEKLPSQELKDEINEFELCQRYHDPILSGLFDDPSNDVLFRWTSVTNQEAKSGQGSGAISKQRPDSVVTELDGLYFGRSLGFVEAKCAKEAGNKFAVSKDLVRLGTQSKNAIDRSDAQGCLSVQIVGQQMTFFMTSLVADGFYTMSELLSITTPSSIESVQGFVSYCDELLSVIQCFENWCLPVQSRDAPLSARKRKTLPDEDLDVIAARPRTNKRRCFTSH